MKQFPNIIVVKPFDSLRIDCSTNHPDAIVTLEIALVLPDFEPAINRFQERLIQSKQVFQITSFSRKDSLAFRCVATNNAGHSIFLFLGDVVVTSGMKIVL